MRGSATGRRDLIILSIVWAIALVASGVDPYDRFTWVLEVLPAVIALPILWLTRQQHPFTTLVYGLILFHGLVLILGGTYTYARTPLGSGYRSGSILNGIPTTVWPMSFRASSRP